MVVDPTPGPTREPAGRVVFQPTLRQRIDQVVPERVVPLRALTPYPVGPAVGIGGEPVIDCFETRNVVVSAIETLSGAAAPGAEVLPARRPQFIQQQAAGQLVQGVAALTHGLDKGHLLQGGVPLSGFVLGQPQQRGQERPIEPVRDGRCAHGLSQPCGQRGQEGVGGLGYDALALGEGGGSVHRAPPQLRRLLRSVAMALGSPWQE